MQPEHRAGVLGDPAAQGFDQLSAFLAGGALRQVGQRLGIGLSLDDGVEHGAPAVAQHVGQDAADLEGASSNTFWMRRLCCETSRTSCLRVRVRSRSC
jgi:hypothetical protein